MNEDRETAIAHVSERLALLTSGALTTLELLDDWRVQVEHSPSLFENPHAIGEYLDFFIRMVGSASVECERIRAQLPQNVEDGQLEILRRIASDAANERQRCLVFRDKWINKPLPDESVRTLLNDISVTTRDQLAAFAELDLLASSLDALIQAGRPPPAPEQQRAFDRRALFMRLFRG